MRVLNTAVASYPYNNCLVRWTEVAELLEDDLMSREEVGSMFEALPKAKGRGSSTSAPAIDVKGFVEFARKVNKGDRSICLRMLIKRALQLLTHVGEGARGKGLPNPRVK